MFLKIGDMIVEKDKDKLTFYFLDMKTKTFFIKEIQGEDLKRLASLLWAGGIQ